MFLNILTQGAKDNTYKFALARFLLEYSKSIDKDVLLKHVKNDTPYIIDYKKIAHEFLKYYWSQEFRYRFKQNFHNRKTPLIIKTLRNIFGNVYIPESFEKYSQESTNFENIKQAEKIIMRGMFGTRESKTSNVIPRFQKIRFGNKFIQNNIFYEFDDHDKQISVNPNAMLFFNNNYPFLFKTTILEWAGFLEKINTFPRLIAKIESGETIRGSLKIYKKIFVNTKHCFYCNVKLDMHKTDVDHFIPWSYIFNDKAWNLVLACESCNRRKSSSLVDDCYYNMLIKRNSCLYPVLKPMRESLHELDVGNGWSAEIRRYYDNCVKHGFPIIPRFHLLEDV
ncbi:MAG: HNH endonuclease [Cenarchaeum symbiont of Oopsacas minuta]|nr:HNH endonuclease [Cenarchaeum symbiont of Oopsacas minuta]